MSQSAALPADRFRPQVDGLRAVAVLGVMVHHFWQPGIYGFLGVRLFFVISGFLITGILVDARERAGQAPLWQVLKVFYVRRALRILPAYYLTLTGIFLLSRLRPLPSFDEGLPYHVLFLSNFHAWAWGGWPPFTGHLWTLGVEEQFYLVWPLLVLLVPRARLWLALVGTLLLSIGFRLAIWHPDAQGVGLTVLTPVSFGAFAVGGMLSLWVRAGVRWTADQVLAAFVVLALAVVAIEQVQGPMFAYVLGMTIQLAPIAALILGAWLGFGGWPGRFLSAPPMQAIGRLSYGIYLFHIPVKEVLERGLTELGVPVAQAPGMVRFAVPTAVTIIAAQLSWRWIEQPIRALKHRFPYPEAGDPSLSRPAAP